MFDFRFLLKFVPRWQFERIICQTQSKLNGEFHKELLWKLTAQLRSAPNINADAKPCLHRPVKAHYTYMGAKEYFFSHIEPVNLIGYGFSFYRDDYQNIKIGYTHFSEFLYFDDFLINFNNHAVIDLDLAEKPLEVMIEEVKARTDDPF